MDCLDRTNVVQGVFSRYISFFQLNKMGLLQIPDKLNENPFAEFPSGIEEDYRNAWTCNADVIS